LSNIAGQRDPARQLGGTRSPKDTLRQPTRLACQHQLDVILHTTRHNQQPKGGYQRFQILAWLKRTEKQQVAIPGSETRLDLCQIVSLQS